MANVTVWSGGSMYGPSGGTMPSLGLSEWTSAEIGGDGASATLRPRPTSFLDAGYSRINLTGSGLSLASFPSGATLGQISANASGVVTSFAATAGTYVSHGATYYNYSITGLAVSFADLLTNSADPLAFLLSGDDMIVGSDYLDILAGYAGDDVILPGFANRSSTNEIIDGGEGADTVSFANLAVAVSVDLATRTAHANGASATMRISTGLISIENATGGAGDDALTGDEGANRLDGGDGNDTLDGGAGGDTLLGGDGDDWLKPGTAIAWSGGADFADGGAGVDTVSFETSTAGLAIDLATGVAYNPLNGSNFVIAYATLVSIENAVGGAGADTISGDEGANDLDGLGGDDTLDGRGGADRLYGGEGDDTLLGGASDDQLYGGAGDNTLVGGAGADRIEGGDGFDTADFSTSAALVDVNLATGLGFGGDAHGDRLVSIDALRGSAFADILTGGIKQDTIWGGNGADRVFGLESADLLFGEAGDDAVFGGEGGDFLSGGAGADGLFGEAGGDAIFAGEGDDYVEGGAGNDLIWGDAGNDRIDAGSGSDFVVLGAGDDGVTLGADGDRVRFDYGSGRDTIFDFGNGWDVLDFTWTDLGREAVQANTFDTASGVLIVLGADSILLAGLQTWQLDWATDFAFA